MPTDHNRLLQEMFDYWWDKAVKIYPKHNLEKPIIRLSKRITAKFGLAYLINNTISISANQFEAYTKFFRDDLIPHELAHILAWQVYSYGMEKGEVHGEVWQRVCRELGVPPLRLYDWDYIHERNKP